MSLSKNMLLLTAWLIALSIASLPAIAAPTALCGLRSEVVPFDLTPRRDRPKVRWGINIPNYVRLLANLQTGAPKRVSDLLVVLKNECAIPFPATAVRKQAACAFIPAYQEHQRLQKKLHALLNDKTFEVVGSPDEIVFRAINWTLDPFSDKVSQTPGQPSEAIRTLVEWLMTRQSLIRHLDAVGEWFRALGRGTANRSRQEFLPALKAHFFSPLLVGQIAFFLRDQECSLKYGAVCREANRQLKAWLLEQMQSYRARLSHIKCLFEDRLKSSAPHSIPSDLNVLGRLYSADGAFRKNESEQTQAYLKYLEEIVTTNDLPDTASPKTRAKLGIIVASEILHIFQHTIPEQEPMSSDIIHQDIAPLELRIENELRQPLEDLEVFVTNYERDLR